MQPLHDSTLNNYNWVIQNFTENDIETLDSINQKIQGYWILGMAVAQNSDNSKAIALYQKALKLSIDIKDSTAIIKSYQGMGFPYFALGKYAEVLQVHTKSLNIAEELNDSSQMSLFLMSIGAAYYYLKNKEKCMEFQLEALKLATKVNNVEVVMKSSKNISAVYSEMGKTDSAVKYMEYFISYVKPNDYAQLSYSYAILSVAYDVTKRFTQKKEAVDKSLYFASKTSDKTNRAFALLKRTEIYKYQKKIDSALADADTALEIYRKGKLIDGIQYAINIKNWVLEDANNPDILINGLKEIISIKDTLYNLEVADQVANYKTLYETEKKEKENLALVKQNQFNKEEVVFQKRKNQTILVVSFLVLCLLLLLVFIVVYRTRVNQREESSKIEKERYKSVLAAEEKERVRIARELHDGLGQILSTAKMHVSAIENSKGVQMINFIDNASNLIDQAVVEVRAVSHNLMPATLMKLGFKLAIEELVEKINAVGRVQVNLNLREPFGEMPANLEITLYRIIQEILNNALKHSNAKSIDIGLKVQNNRLFLSISDDGVGFDTTQIEQAKGIGWKNIFSRISMLGGDIDVNSQKNMGSNINISLPI